VLLFRLGAKRACSQPSCDSDACAGWVFIIAGDEVERWGHVPLQL
jgi:hypothetical protein